MSSWKHDFAEDLARAMRTWCLDVHELSSRSLVGRGTIKHMLNGEPFNTPTATLEALARALGMRLSIRLVPRENAARGETERD